MHLAPKTLHCSIWLIHSSIINKCMFRIEEALSGKTPTVMWNHIYNTSEWRLRRKKRKNENTNKLQKNFKKTSIETLAFEEINALCLGHVITHAPSGMSLNLLAVFLFLFIIFCVAIVHFRFMALAPLFPRSTQYLFDFRFLGMT